MTLALPANNTNKSVVKVKVKDKYGKPEGLWEKEVKVCINFYRTKG